MGRGPRSNQTVANATRPPARLFGSPQSSKVISAPKETLETSNAQIVQWREDLESLPEMISLAEQAKVITTDYDLAAKKYGQMFRDAEQDGYQIGTSTVSAADGSKTVKQPDGTVTTTSPDGEEQTISGNLGPRVDLFMKEGSQIQQDQKEREGQLEALRAELWAQESRINIKGLAGSLPLDSPMRFNVDRVLELLALRTNKAGEGIILKDNDQYRDLIKQAHEDWDSCQPRVYKRSGRPGYFTIFDARSGRVIEDNAGTGISDFEARRDYPLAWEEAYPNGYHDSSD